MFRRHWSGLPKDASFPRTLEGLGYFINDADEVRSIENPDCYFKFFIDKNMRVNIRQRFEFHAAIQNIVHERLEENGLRRTLLPLGSTSSDPHIPIFISSGLETKSRITVIFGEPTQELGVLAHRVMEGPGGLNKGSMVSVVRSIHQQTTSDNDPSTPGVILANTGETYWWPDEKRSLTVTGSMGIPLPSLAHSGRRYVKALNEIPGNKDAAEHVEYIFRTVLKTLASENASIDIIAIGTSCEIIEKFLDTEKNWLAWGPRLSSMLLIGTVYPTDSLTNAAFKEFLAKRTCGYILSSDPLGTPQASATGNPDLLIPELGCPLYSSAEPHYIELILVHGQEKILPYLHTAVLPKKLENDSLKFPEHPPIEIIDEQVMSPPPDEMPSMSTADPEEMKRQVKQYMRWKKFAETGEAPDDSSDED